MYIEIHYQINVENDQIESDVALFAIADQAQLLKDELNSKKNLGLIMFDCLLLNAQCFIEGELTRADIGLLNGRKKRW